MGTSLEMLRSRVIPLAQVVGRSMGSVPPVRRAKRLRKPGGEGGSGGRVRRPPSEGMGPVSILTHSLAVVAGMGIMIWYDSLDPDASLPEQMKGIMPRFLDRDALGDDGVVEDPLLNAALKRHIPSVFNEDEENEAQEVVRERLRAHMPRFFENDDDDDDDGGDGGDGGDKN